MIPKLTPMQTRIVEALRASDDLMTNRDLVEVVYADREDGGPLWATDSLRVTIHEMRPVLARMGMRLEFHRGYRLVEDA